MVTRKEVAERAGVSVTAVSRVMNKSGYVAKEKKAAILKAVDDLGYRPSPAARAMQNRSSRQILFYTKDLSNTFNVDMYRGMINYASQHDYTVILSGTWDIERIKKLMVDGVILPNELVADDYVKSVKNTMAMPTVCASYGTSTQRSRHIPQVDADTYAAMEMLIDYLIEKGHAKIAFATPFLISDENPRGVAYRNKMWSILGDKLDDYIFTVYNNNSTNLASEENYIKHGEVLAKQMVKTQSDATAIVCYNDDTAIGMIQHFHKAGISVPDRFSIVGIDGLAIGEFITPQLTSVALSPFEQGRQCVRVLLDMIAGKRVKGRTKVPIHFLERNSVKDIRQS